jgi:hypothetical protein
MPAAFCLSSASAWSCANCRKSWTAIAVVTSPASRIPTRKRSGSRTRRDENNYFTIEGSRAGATL